MLPHARTSGPDAWLFRLKKAAQIDNEGVRILNQYTYHRDATSA